MHTMTHFNYQNALQNTKFTTVTFLATNMTCIAGIIEVVDQFTFTIYVYVETISDVRCKYSIIVLFCGKLHYIIILYN